MTQRPMFKRPMFKSPSTKSPSTKSPSTKSPSTKSREGFAVRTFLFRLTLCSLALGLLAMSSAASAQSATKRALITGSGSSWSANAVAQWIADVESNNIRVVYSAVGSAQGRKDFAYKTTDFAVTEIGYQGIDPLGNRDDSLGRPYAYLPIVAGGTSFPYQIKIQGKQVRNLRLSGETLTKIFTNQIVNWSDDAITKDNNGNKLPSLPIIPVVHSEGSGSSAQFTRYMDTVYPNLWRPYQGKAGLTEYYPRKGAQIAQNGSDGLMNYITAKSANGSIGIVEYSYALGKNYPVVKLLNKAGYYTLPTQYNVAVALTKAQINNDKSSPNYLLQNLDKVYVATDKRTYPMSSYSYMVIPTGVYGKDEKKVTTGKRQSIADFLYYSICQGQKEVGPIGYSPLPVNLVQAGFSQVDKLKTADPGIDITKTNVKTCKNPTFIAGQPNRNYLAEIAPQPPACDKTGAGPCADGVTGTTTSTTAVSGSKPTATAAAGSGGGTGGGGAAVPGAVVQGAAAPTAAVVDPQTGQVTGGTTADGTSADAAAVSTELAGYRSSKLTNLLAPLAVVLLLLALVAPPLVARRLSANKARGSS